MSDQTPCHTVPTSPVYGPITSWRYGQSLGLDVIYRDSICSFNCVYCQLGQIHQVIDRQDVFVPTVDLLKALDTVDMSKVDWVTFSGSGEPTLALNMGEIIDAIRDRYDKPVLVLTNSTWLHDAATRRRLLRATVVDCKLDAASDAMLARMNRPAAGVTLDRILGGIRAMRCEPGFEGRLVVQCMFMPMNLREAAELADIIASIRPDEVQLNTPRRPKLREWTLNSRAGLTEEQKAAASTLSTITAKQAEEVETLLRDRTGVPIRSVYSRN